MSNDFMNKTVYLSVEDSLESLACTQCEVCCALGICPLFLMSKSGLTRQILRASNLHTAKGLFHGQLESHLKYGLVMWGGTSYTNL